MNSFVPYILLIFWLAPSLMSIVIYRTKFNEIPDQMIQN